MIKISFECVAYDNEKGRYFFPIWDCDGLACTDLEFKKARTIEKYRPDGLFKGPKYGTIEYHEGKLICGPLFFNKVMIYDIEKDNTDYIPICNTPGKDLFFESIQYKEWTYFFPGTFQSIIRVNSKTKEIENYSDPVKHVKQLSGEDVLARHGKVVIGSKVYLACLYSPYVLEFDMENGDYKTYKVAGEDKRITSICKGEEGNDCWILLEDGGVIRWDYNAGTINEYRGIGETQNNSELAYAEMVYYERRVVVFPFFGKKWYAINVDRGDCEEIMSFSDSALFFLAYKNGDNVYAFSHTKRTIYKYNLKRRMIEDTMHVELDDKFINDNFRQIHADFKDDLVFLEKCESSLSVFIDYLSNNKKISEGSNI